MAQQEAIAVVLKNKVLMQRFHEDEGQVGSLWKIMKWEISVFCHSAVFLISYRKCHIQNRISTHWIVTLYSVTFFSLQYSVAFFRNEIIFVAKHQPKILLMHILEWNFLDVSYNKTLILMECFAICMVTKLSKYHWMKVAYCVNSLAHVSLWRLLVSVTCFFHLLAFHFFCQFVLSQFMNNSS